MGVLWAERLTGILSRPRGARNAPAVGEEERMSGRRENFAKDNKRNSRSKKLGHKRHEAEFRQKAELVARLWKRAKAEEARA